MCLPATVLFSIWMEQDSSMIKGRLPFSLVWQNEKVVVTDSIFILPRECILWR